MNQIKNLFLVFVLVTCSFANALPSRSQKKVAEVFEEEKACFLLKSPQAKRPEIKWGGKQCQEALSPEESFYLPLSLIATDLGMLQDEKTLFKWDGIRHENPLWNKDQFVTDWIQNRVGWVTERLVNQIGIEPLQKYFSVFNYGNRNSKLNSLKITPVQQLEFIEGFFGQSLGVKTSSWQLPKKLFYLGKFRNGVEVWGQKASGKNYAWFVGHLVRGAEQWNFVSLILGPAPSKEAVTAERAQALSMDALTQLEIF
jgi:beta-lactamase class D